MKGEWILKEVYFEDGWPSVMRDPITPQQPWLGIDCPRCGHCCPQRLWVGLTDDEIANLIENYDVASPDYARAIEAKLKEKNIKRFAVLVAAHEREKVAQWMVERGYATGHGDTIEDLLTEINWQAAEREREGCASVAESYEPTCDTCPSGVANAIRAREEK